MRPEEISFSFVGLGDFMTHICRSCVLYSPSPPTHYLPTLRRKIYAFQRVIPPVNCKSPSKMVNTALLPNRLQYSQCKLLVESKYRCQIQQHTLSNFCNLRTIFKSSNSFRGIVEHLFCTSLYLQILFNKQQT